MYECGRVCVSDGCHGSSNIGDYQNWWSQLTCRKNKNFNNYYRPVPIKFRTSQYNTFNFGILKNCQLTLQGTPSNLRQIEIWSSNMILGHPELKSSQQLTKMSSK